VIDLAGLFVLFFTAAVLNNFVFYRFLGMCAYLGLSKSIDTSVGMGLAVTFVMVIANVVTWFIQWYLLAPMGLQFLELMTFILVIAAVVQLIEMYMKKHVRRMFDAFGIYLPLITTNCTILGITLLNVIAQYDLVQSVVFALGAGAGYTLALLLLAGIRERLELADVPECLQGVPISLITTGLLALAFSGFTGMV
jgi:electron transport complex protein RnfA